MHPNYVCPLKFNYRVIILFAVTHVESLNTYLYEKCVQRLPSSCIQKTLDVSFDFKTVSSHISLCTRTQMQNAEGTDEVGVCLQTD